MEKGRFMEIRIISAEDLDLSGRPIKGGVFVTVQTDPNCRCSTGVYTEGGSYRYLNENLQMPLPSSSRAVLVEVNCKTSSGVKKVGTAEIPISDFDGGNLPKDYLHILSYRLREGNGRRNGIINLSIRIKSSAERRGYPMFSPLWVAGG
ncbi:hypothetical protein QJS10_CPA10g00655 [Acorus calamus]|uniref:Uncharacterized protein n=1 Tax=Acorus calamus TaxID=4465 RepID=A0AAV9DWH7_ACOCL|nr:hypothetical protein QJS10_CPA10g00655 [Acorus calamus]